MLPTQTGLRTKATGTSSRNTAPGDGLITSRYEDVIPAKLPMAVLVAPPRVPPVERHPALGQGIPEGVVEEEGEERKRDSGLAPTTSSKVREGSPHTWDGKEKEDGLLDGSKAGSGSSVPTSMPITPNIKKSQSVASSTGSITRKWKAGSKNGISPKIPSSARISSPSEEDFSPITTPIPTDSILDADFLNQLSFSKRGSVLLSGKKALKRQSTQNLEGSQPTLSILASPSIKVLSDDLEAESKKVRSLYEAGPDSDRPNARILSMADHLNVGLETAAVTLGS